MLLLMNRWTTFLLVLYAGNLSVFGDVDIFPSDSETFFDCLEGLNQIRVGEFHQKSAKLAKIHGARRALQNHHQRQQRDYSAGKCGTFVIFPFLAFLYSASVTSVNVMNTINNSNENTNENMNMNVNMNTRRRRRRRGRRDAEPITTEASLLEETWRRSIENLPNLSELFHLPTENISENLKKLRQNFVQELEKFKIPGLPSVGELKDTWDEKETLEGRQEETLSRKLFADLFHLPEVFPKSREDISRLLPSSFQITPAAILELLPNPTRRELPAIPAPLENPLSFLLKKSSRATAADTAAAAEQKTTADQTKVEKIDTEVEEADDTQIDDLEVAEKTLDTTLSSISTAAVEAAPRIQERRVKLPADSPAAVEVESAHAPTSSSFSSLRSSSRRQKKISVEKIKGFGAENVPPTELKNKPREENNFSLRSFMNATIQSVWNSSLSFPIFRELSEDISKVSEIITNSSKQITANDFDERIRSDLDNLHITHRVKNASEEIKKFKLPGLPSIGEILNNSLNISSKIQNLPSLVSPLNVLRSLRLDTSTELDAETGSQTELTPSEEELLNPQSRSSVASRPISSDNEDEEEDNKSLEENLMEGIKHLVDTSLIKLRYSLDEATKVFMSEETGNYTSFDPKMAVKNFSISLLEGLDALPVPASLDGLVNPKVDVDNFEKVLKLLPHMIPYIVQDYKDRLHGLMVGTRITQEQLFEIHSSLVDWHNKIDSVRDELPGGEIHRVLGILQDHNLVLMSLLIHLMTEAGEEGDVGLTHHHLQVIDRHLIKAEDLFPGLKHLKHLL